MLRTTTSRSLYRSLSKPQVHAAQLAPKLISIKLRNASSQHTPNRPQLKLHSVRSAALSMKYATKSSSATEKVADRILEAHPEEVSGDSSVRHVFESSSKASGKDDVEMLGGIKSDIETIKETFSLGEVPKESLYLGMAGVLPYAATSLSTVALASEIKQAHSTGSGNYLSAETAHQLLDLVTPIQIGYGAVIISFLGAIHWGLEYAGYGGYHSYRRYMIGVIAPAVAWPTMFMPVEYALITQFAAFNALYFADARATVRGWCPPWYSTYRFVLTFLVGASIVVSLVGRGQIVSHDAKLRSPVDYIKQDRDSQWVALEREEKERLKAKVAADEAAEEEDDGDEVEEEKEKKDKKKDEKKGEKK